MNKFEPEFARRLKRKHQGYGDTYYLDEVFVKIRGKEHYLWHAVYQDVEVVDVYLQERRDAKAAKGFFQRFLNAGGVPGEIITDKLRSLWCRTPIFDPWIKSQHRAIRQQSSRAIASTYPRPRARHASFQIDHPGAEIPGKSRCRLQPIQSAQAFVV